MNSILEGVDNQGKNNPANVRTREKVITENNEEEYNG